MSRWIAVVTGVAFLLAGCAKPLQETWRTPRPQPGSEVAAAVVMASEADPYAAGRRAAEALEGKFLGGPKVVLVSESFAGEKNKRRLLKGICSVLPPEVVFGGATHGSMTKDGCYDRDTVVLLGLAGRGLGVRAALERNLAASGPASGAGARLARKIGTASDDRLLVVVADARSPKNGPLVQGIQDVLGKRFPIVGGSVNGNAGQNFVYYQGRMFSDAAVGLMLSGAFSVALSGRQAKDAKAVVKTAEAAAAMAEGHAKGIPFLALVFDSARRRDTLARPADELDAIQRVLTKNLPVFGCYCAGEIGPADTADASPSVLSHGLDWHIVMALLAR